MASRDKVDVDALHKGIQYALEKLGKLKFGLKEQQYQILKANDTWALGTILLFVIPVLRVLVLTKRHVGSGNEIVPGLVLCSCSIECRKQQSCQPRSQGPLSTSRKYPGFGWSRVYASQPQPHRGWVLDLILPLLSREETAMLLHRRYFHLKGKQVICQRCFVST